MMGNHAKMACKGQLKAVLAISPFVATLCPGKTAGFIPFQVAFTTVVKAFQAALECLLMRIYSSVIKSLVYFVL